MLVWHRAREREGGALSPAAVCLLRSFVIRIPIPPRCKTSASTNKSSEIARESKNTKKIDSTLPAPTSNICCFLSSFLRNVASTITGSRRLQRTEGVRYSRKERARHTREERGAIEVSNFVISCPLTQLSASSSPPSWLRLRPREGLSQVESNLPCQTESSCFKRALAEGDGWESRRKESNYSFLDWMFYILFKRA